MKTFHDIFYGEELAEARPFYIILTVLILITCALTLFQPPNPMPFSRLPLFGLLLLLHLGLHWTSGLVARRSRWREGYLVGQGALALALALLSQRPELVLTLYGALVAETLGFFGLTRLAGVSVAGYVSFTFVAYFLLGGQPLLAEWASPAISTLLLCIVFMVLYRRQSEARQRGQALLAELETAHHQLADYAAQVEDLTLAAERQRMARELHDTLAQGVAGLVLRLEAANNHLENGRIPRAHEIVQQSMKRARSTLADSRAAIDDLRLEARSLSEAIHHHTERFTRATGIPCHLKLDLGDETAVPSAIADHAERIISESLTNIARHAQADNVWLDVVQTPEQLTIDVRDDGVGFDMETAVRTGHYGLLGMRERTRLVNGTFALTSQVQAGTSLHILLPLEVS